MASKRIIALLFLFIPFLCFSADLKSESQFVNSGGKTILKTKISNLLPGQTAKLNIVIYSDNIGLKPVSIFQKYITTSDLDKNGYYSYTLDSSFPASQFKAVSGIKMASAPNKTANLAVSGINCSDEDICHEIIKMDFSGLSIKIKYPTKENVVKAGIECRRNDGEIEENFYEDNSLNKIKSKVISFKKKYQDDYVCQPYIVTTGFMGLKFTDWGKEFDFPNYPNAKTLPLEFDKNTKNLKISGQAESGGQSYYYWFVIQDQNSGEFYCALGQVFPSSKKTAYFSIYTNKNQTLNHCNSDLTPNINSNRIFQFSPNVNYKIAFLIKGSQDKKIAGKETQNFLPFSISGRLPETNPIIIEKNSQKGMIRISSYVDKNNLAMKQWFLIRENNSGLKYKILDGDVKEIDSDSKITYYTDLKLGKIRVQEIQTGKIMDFVFSINKKYYVSFCLENDIGKNCSEKIEPIDTSNMQKTIYGGDTEYGDICTHESFAKRISLSDAAKLAEKIGSDIGIRKEFLLAILIQESNLGTGMGGCLYHSDTGRYCNARSQKDFEIFKKLCQDLGLDWKKIEVSCGGSGTGGAMGFAQFMPKEWITRSGKIKSKTLHNPASPWNACDATVAAAFYLKEKGAKANGNGERSAAIAYNGWAWYGDQVVSRTKCIIKYWNNFSAMDINCR